MSLYPLLSMAMVVIGLASNSCSSPDTVSLSQLEANDTIVNFGRYHVLIPRSAACAWTLNSTTTAPEASIWFDGCGETSYSVATGAVLFEGIDRLDKERLVEFMAAARFNMEGRDCSIRRLREGRIGHKEWSLCEGPTIGGEGIVYNLHVAIYDKKYYFIFKCEVGPTYYETFHESGEVERIVNAVQVW